MKSISKIAMALALVCLASGMAMAESTTEASMTAAMEPKDFDGFEYDKNLFRGKSGDYQQPPSRIFAVRSTEESHSGTKALKLRYDKKGAGGPSNQGGWCGYWTYFKSNKKYFDATPYKKLSFWVKGKEGGEMFRVGLADTHWEKMQDSVKSDDVTTYIPGGRVTTEWQKVEIPLDTWFVDMKELASLAVCFESDTYEDGSQTGMIYIDDIRFE